MLHEVWRAERCATVETKVAKSAASCAPEGAVSWYSAPISRARTVASLAI
jgi:hypothetical protein